jgi:deoxyribonuclease-2
MIFSFLAFLATTGIALECKDEQGSSVESWEILKFPQSTSYVYSTNTSPSPYDLNSTSEGALGLTMQQLWLTPQPFYALYNDEPPYETSYNFSAAHAKAIFFWDSSTAVAIFHSIPMFPVGPQQSSEYIGLLHNAWEYAQHIVCLSTTPSALQEVLPLIAGLYPNVYGGTLPNAVNLPDNQCSYTPLENRMLITKSGNYLVDIWSECVSPYFSTPLRVISWVHGEREGPVCNSTLSTTDITEIAYSFGVMFSEYDNHAKWALGTYPFLCFGDLNRVTTQKSRAGSVLCWKDDTLYDSLDAIVGSTDSCGLALVS